MSTDSAPELGSRTREEEDTSAQRAVLFFPIIVLLASLAAFLAPEPFLPLKPYIPYSLMLIIFCMGLTITIPDLTLVAKRPLPIVLGVIAQYVVMPLAAVAVAKILGLSPQLAVGLLLLGSVSGGTASNVIAYLARGDVALSVAMTSISTLLSPLVTPLLMLLLAGASMEIDGLGMAKTLAQTVLLPVIAGLIVRMLASSAVDKLMPILPWISILGITAVITPAVASNAGMFATAGAIAFLAVVIHNLIGYVLGYGAARAFRLPRPVCRTTAIEVGTQNAGLSSGMSATFFSAEAAIPGAVAAVWHNIAGSLYAAWVRRKSA